MAQEIIPKVRMLRADKGKGIILMESVMMQGKSIIVSNRALSIKVANITAAEAKITALTKQISLTKRLLVSNLSFKFIRFYFSLKNSKRIFRLNKKSFKRGFNSRILPDQAIRANYTMISFPFLYQYSFSR